MANLPRHTESAIDTLSEAWAAGNLLRIPKTVCRKDAFDACSEGREALEQKGIEVWMPFDNLEDDDLYSNLDNFRDIHQRIMKDYAEHIKRGATILTIDASLDSDVNAWDMNHLATIGYNTSQTQDLNGMAVTFDEVSCKWVNEDDGVFPFNPENGLPVFE